MNNLITTPPERKKRHYFRWFLIVVISIGAYNVFKPLPPGISIKSNIATVPESSIQFLADLTYTDQNGVQKSEQTIFDEVFKMIGEANEYILIDMFLWNAWTGTDNDTFRPLSEELTDALIAKKKTNQEIIIAVISDPINTVYGGNESLHFKKLQEAGIPVIETKLTALRDSNPLYSAFWRTGISWWDPLHHLITGINYSFRPAPNPFATNGTPTTIRSYLTLINFKANHRKLLITDFTSLNGDRKMATLVTSANPHDGSSAHTNVAIRVDDFLWRNALESERSVATFSKKTLPLPNNADTIVNETGPINVRLITEGKIKETAIEIIRKTDTGDSIAMNMFYLAEREIINELIKASVRGVTIRLILDPNKDAFGRKKNGVPNRPVAAELIKKSDGKITVRWCNTQGEQCHSKILLVISKHTNAMLLGSANFTRRNIGDYNLETNVLIESTQQFKAFSDAIEYFETMWTNKDGKIFTTDYNTYKDTTIRHYLLYRAMEQLGTSSF